MTLTAQQESPPYQYVMVEGPVTVNHEDLDVVELATHYLGPEMGAWYARNNPSNAESVAIRLWPEQWLTVDYGKVM